MKKNLGGLDKAIRVLTATLLGVLYYYDIISGSLAYALMGLAIYVLITCLFNFSPIYEVLGINTCKNKGGSSN